MGEEGDWKEAAMQRWQSSNVRPHAAAPVLTVGMLQHIHDRMVRIEEL